MEQYLPELTPLIIGTVAFVIGIAFASVSAPGCRAQRALQGRQAAAD
jgi:hypothetical protein